MKDVGPYDSGWTLTVTWDGAPHGVRARVVDTAMPPVPNLTRQPHQALTVEQAAVAMTSLAEVINPLGELCHVLGIEWDATVGKALITTDVPGEPDEILVWGIDGMRPTRSLLLVIADRYGRGVTLAEPHTAR